MSHFTSKRRVFTGTLCGLRLPVGERNVHEASCATCKEQVRIMTAQNRS